MKKLLLIKYAEIALKGKNIKSFERQLIRNIKDKLKGLEFQINFNTGRIYVQYSDDQEVIRRLQQVFGIVEICPCYKAENTTRNVADTVLLVLKDKFEHASTFGVNTRRVNKSIQQSSMEFSAEVGSFILREHPHLSVDLKYPEIKVEIELRECAYIYFNGYRGLGGLPYLSGGKSLLLLSGGIDSPVAAYQIARRGVRIYAVHFHSFPFTSEMSQEKIRYLVKDLVPYLNKVVLFHVNILEAQKDIRDHVDSKYFTLLQRRVMVKIANQLARRNKIFSLTTGENLAQVSSQTMKAIACINEASDLPIFRPLISFDKEEIVRRARKIGTYEHSILPFDDCCTLFAPGKVEIFPKLSDILEQESKCHLDEIQQRIIREHTIKEVYSSEDSLF